MRPVSPATVDPDRFTLSITADGKPLETDQRVIRVDIWSALNASAKAKVVMMAGTPPDGPFSTRIFQAADSGKAIEIRGRLRASFERHLLRHRRRARSRSRR